MEFIRCATKEDTGSSQEEIRNNLPRKYHKGIPAGGSNKSNLLWIRFKREIFVFAITCFQEVSKRFTKRLQSPLRGFQKVSKRCPRKEVEGRDGKRKDGKGAATEVEGCGLEGGSFQGAGGLEIAALKGEWI